jgi:hypothetical protein
MQVAKKNFAIFWKKKLTLLATRTKKELKSQQGENSRRLYLSDVVFVLCGVPSPGAGGRGRRGW